MIRVVIDTNVVISSLITETGAEAAILDLVAEGALTWCVSEAILAEYEETVNRPKFRQINPKRTAAMLSLARSGEFTVVELTLNHSSDEPDNRFYECAQAARADYLVTGNLKHFKKPLPGTKIVNARQLLDALRK